MKFLYRSFKLIKEDQKTIATNYFSLFVLQGANYILPLITLPYLVRVLGVEKFGLVMFAQALVTFLSVFVDFGFNLSGTREVSLRRKKKEELADIFSAIMTIKFGLLIAAFFILFCVIHLFTRFQMDSDVYYLSFGIVIGNSLFPTWFFQGTEKMKFITLINILARVIFLILVFVLIKKESDYILVPLFNSLGFIVSGLIGLLFSLKYVKIKWPRFDLIRRLFIESSSLFISNLATTLYTSCNVFILGIFAGNSIAGVYSSMEKLILAIKNIYTPLYQAIYPWLTKQNKQKKKQIILRLTPFILFISLFIMLFILAFGNEVLSIIYNDPFISNYAPVFKILGLISIFSALNMLYNTLYLPATKKYQTRMFILVTGGIFNLILSLFLVQRHGIYGTAYSVVSTEFILLILGALYFRKYSKE